MLNANVTTFPDAGTEPEKHEDMTIGVPQHRGRPWRAHLRVEEHLEEEEGEEEEEKEREEKSEGGESEIRGTLLPHLWK